MHRRRYFRILWFFGWAIFSLFFWDVVFPRVGLKKLSRKTRSKRMVKLAVRFRQLAVQMGGVMIKVGQFLSSRLDVLPREFTTELANLQDEVAAEPFEPIQQVIEAEFGCKIEEKFSYFEPLPMAAASIGQVYYARLCNQDEDGTPCPRVVVKVQRPHIEEIITTDLQALKIVGGWLQKYPPLSKRVNISMIFDEFSHTLYEEVDYLHEGKNAEIFAENFKEHEEVLVPHVIWSHTTKRVLTLEDVGGIKITDYASIEAAGIDRVAVAKRLLDTYLKQVFEDGFFHADPHPGNLFVRPAPTKQDEKNWQLVFVDFGMAGTLTETTFNGLREVLIAIATQDAHRLIHSYQTLGVLLPGADIEELERASQSVFESLWGKTTKQMMSMHAEEAKKFVDEFGDLLYDMPFQIPENIILLGRCVSILAGISSGLNPEFNIWESLSPYAATLSQGEGGDRWKLILEEIVNFLQKAIALPAKMDTVLGMLSQGKLEVRTPALTREVEALTKAQNKTTVAILLAVFLLSAVQLYLAKDMLLAEIAAGVSLIMFLWMLLKK